MQTKEKCLNKTDKYFARLKVLAILAWICTLLLSLVILSNSFFNSEKSSRQSNDFANTIKSIFNINTDVAPKEITANVDNTLYYYYGDTGKINVSTAPTNASKEIVYTANQDDVVFEGNTFRVVTTLKKTIKVTATSKLDDKVKTTFTFYTRGIEPSYSKVSDRRLLFGDEPAGNEVNLEVGKAYLLAPQYALEDSFKQTLPQVHQAEWYQSSGSILPVCEGDADFYFKASTSLITFKKPYQGKMTIKLQTSNKSNPSFYDDEHSFEVNVNATQTVDYAPSTPLTPTISATGLTKIDDFNYNYLWDVSQDGIVVNALKVTGKNTDFDLVPIGNASKYAYFWGKEMKPTANRGEFDVLLKPVMKPELATTIHFVIKEQVPTQLKIAGKQTIARGGSYSTNAVFDVQKLYDTNKVKWSVVEGKENLEIDENTGKITGIGFGKATIQAQSVYYPNLVATHQVTVSVYDNYASFTRKFFGHFLSFALLGFGFAYSYVLVIKRKKLSIPLAIISTLLIASLEEVFQLPIFTQNRGASWLDVGINSFGGLCGITFGLTTIWLFCLILKRISKQKRADLDTAYNQLSLKTMFKKNTHKQ